MVHRVVRYSVLVLLVSCIVPMGGCGSSTEAVKPEKIEPRPPADNSSAGESKEAVKKNTMAD